MNTVQRHRCRHQLQEQQLVLRATSYSLQFRPASSWYVACSICSRIDDRQQREGRYCYEVGYDGRDKPLCHDCWDALQEVRDRRRAESWDEFMATNGLDPGERSAPPDDTIELTNWPEWRRGEA